MNAALYEDMRAALEESKNDPAPSPRLQGDFLLYVLLDALEKDPHLEPEDYDLGGMLALVSEVSPDVVAAVRADPKLAHLFEA